MPPVAKRPVKPKLAGPEKLNNAATAGEVKAPVPKAPVPKAMSREVAAETAANVTTAVAMVAVRIAAVRIAAGRTSAGRTSAGRIVAVAGRYEEKRLAQPERPRLQLTMAMTSSTSATSPVMTIAVTRTLPAGRRPSARSSMGT